MNPTAPPAVLPPRPGENPFCSRRVRPGSIRYLEHESPSVEEVLSRLAAAHGQGQIVGPHGAGKSTLLREIAARLEAAGGRLQFVTLAAGFAWPLVDEQGASAPRRGGTLIVDGFERLSWWRRRGLRRSCRSAGCDLVASCHRDLGLPTLAVVRPSKRTARAVAAALLDGVASAVDQAAVDRAFDACAGNLRETLFALYDVHEGARDRA